jgi:hypothetical protein
MDVQTCLPVDLFLESGFCPYEERVEVSAQIHGGSRAKFQDRCEISGEQPSLA